MIPKRASFYLLGVSEAVKQAASLLSFPRGDVAAHSDDEITRRTMVPGLVNAREMTVVRLAPDGAAVEGASAEALIDSVAYAAQLADLVGEFLGLEAFSQLEVAASDGTWVVLRDAAGGLAAAKGGRGVEPSALRARLAPGEGGRP